LAAESALEERRAAAKAIKRWQNLGLRSEISEGRRVSESEKLLQSLRSVAYCCKYQLPRTDHSALEAAREGSEVLPKTPQAGGS
jgi:hypothetical protein